LSLWRSAAAAAAAAAEFAETDGKHRIVNAKQARKNTECENWDETSRVGIRVLRSVALASRKRSGHCPTRDIYIVRERDDGREVVGYMHSRF
jgi:hypothetical protein